MQATKIIDFFDGPVKFADPKNHSRQTHSVCGMQKPMVFAVANRRFANIENVIFESYENVIS
ncbi:MAG: hypothetical protein ABFC34_12355 [Methanobacterium sp.]